MDNQNLADEHAVLSGIAQHGFEAYLEVADIVKSKTFTLEGNQVIYKCYKKIFDNDTTAQIDSSSILSAAGDIGYKNFFHNQQESKHLRSILNTPVQTTTVRRAATRIRKLEITRLLTEQLLKVVGDLGTITGDESISSIMSKAEGPIFDFSGLVDDAENEPFLLGDQVDQYLKNVEENPNASIGISSPFPIYNELIGGGFRKKNVSIIGARAKAGKSFFSANIAVHTAKQLGIPCLYLDTEMHSEEQIPRMLSNITGKVPYKDIEKAKYLSNYTNRKLVMEAKEALKKMPLSYLPIPGQPFEETLAIMRRWVRKKVGLDKNGVAKDCLIILDYFKVMDGGSINESMKEYQVLGFMLTALQSFAARFQVPILTFIQLNRDGLDKETEAAASGSDRITWYCSNFSILKKKTQEEIANDGGPMKGNRKIVPVLCRHGAPMDDGDYLNMVFNLDVAMITEGKTRNQLSAEEGGGVANDTGFDIGAYTDNEPEDDDDRKSGKITNW